MLMIGLQGVQRILIRSSDTMEATRTKLDGVSLDVGRLVDGRGSGRPAIGLEVCDCPKEFSAR